MSTLFYSVLFCSVMCPCGFQAAEASQQKLEAQVAIFASMVKNEDEDDRKSNYPLLTSCPLPSTHSLIATCYFCF